MNTCQTVSSSPWANAAIIGTALGALVFVGTYAWTTRGAWRRTGVGRNIMGLMAVIALVSVLAVAAIIWGTNWPHREVVRTVSWSAVGFFIWRRLFLLYRVQHRQETRDTTT